MRFRREKLLRSRCRFSLGRQKETSSLRCRRFVRKKKTLTGQVLHAGDAVLLGLVRQHRPGDHVPDREHGARGRGGFEVPVGGDAAALVERDARRFQVQPVEERAASGRDEHDVGLELFGGAALG